MSSATLFFILGIMWWALAAGAVISFMAWIYTQVVYFKWNREDREKELIVQQVQHQVSEEIDKITVDNINE